MLTTRLVRRALKNPVEDTVKTDLSGDVPLVGLICVHLVDFLMRLTGKGRGEAHGEKRQ